MGTPDPRPLTPPIIWPHLSHPGNFSRGRSPPNPFLDTEFIPEISSVGCKHRKTRQGSSGLCSCEQMGGSGPQGKLRQREVREGMEKAQASTWGGDTGDVQRSWRTCGWPAPGASTQGNDRHPSPGTPGTQGHLSVAAHAHGKDVAGHRHDEAGAHVGRGVVQVKDKVEHLA